jgi:hypothetical protein
MLFASSVHYVSADPVYGVIDKPSICFQFSCFCPEQLEKQLRKYFMVIVSRDVYHHKRVAFVIYVFIYALDLPIQ